MFWGLRECRSINLQSIQQAVVMIDCDGAKIKKHIRDVQKAPNFESTPTDSDKFRLRIVITFVCLFFNEKYIRIVKNLPTNRDFWPNLTITCIQHRYFGMSEVIGNLVVTDITKFIEVSKKDPSTENQKQNPFAYTKLRKSIVDAYHSNAFLFVCHLLQEKICCYFLSDVINEKNPDLAKRKSKVFEDIPSEIVRVDSELPLVDENETKTVCLNF